MKDQKKNIITDLKPKDLMKVPLYDNSFETCVFNITGLYATEFQSIDMIVYTVGLENWYQPYIDVLRTHGYDMVFFNYRDNDSAIDIIINDKKSLDDYTLTNLPSGKCVMLGKDSNDYFRCVVGQMLHNKVKIIYDPKPELDLVEIFEFGYFINTFITPELESSEGV